MLIDERSDEATARDLRERRRRARARETVPGKVPGA